MSLQLVIESFCFGNIKIVPNFEKDYIHILEFFESTIENRDLDTLWCLVTNVNTIMDIFSLDFLKFVKEIFNIIDRHYDCDYSKITFDNPVSIKIFIINEINFMFQAYSTSDHHIPLNIVDYYTKNFVNELDYISQFKLITKYNMPIGEKWTPEWKINYNNNEIVTSNIDIFLDNYIIVPSIDYLSNMENILEKMVTRLTFLKQKCPSYFNQLERYLPEFSKFIFNNYPYYEIVNFYGSLVKISDIVYVPEHIPRQYFNGINIVFSVIPKDLASYILGFPCITTGELSEKLIYKFTSDIIKDKDRYFENKEDQNKRIIDSNMFIKQCGNGFEEEDILDLMYNPIKSYNANDVVSILSNTVYFVFTYPEFNSIIKSNTNPYNKVLFSDNFINHIENIIRSKNSILETCKKRGLHITLQGTMEDNYDELTKNIKVFKPSVMRFDTRYIMRNNLFNYIFDNFREVF